jgi:hypothetical protein
LAGETSSFCSGQHVNVKTHWVALGDLHRRSWRIMQKPNDFPIPILVASQGVLTSKCWPPMLLTPRPEFNAVVGARIISDNPEQGRMTRLWCRSCLSGSGRDYPPCLGFLIVREIFQHHYPDS